MLQSRPCEANSKPPKPPEAADMIEGMTQLDVLYRYGAPPTESAALAIGRIREVYGVRNISFDQAEKTVRVEYDATRLNEAMIHQLLRRAGLDIVERLPMFAEPQPVPEPAAAAPPAAK